MSHTLDYKLRAAVLSLGTFTVATLAKAAGVEYEAAKSWIRRERERNQPLITPVSGESARKKAPGRPANYWTVASGLEEDIRESLLLLYPFAAAEDPTAPPYMPSLAKAESLLRDSEAAGDGDISQDLRATAKEWLIVTWEHVHETDGVTVPGEVLERIARVEASLLGGSNIPRRIERCLELLRDLLRDGARRWGSAQMSARMLLLLARRAGDVETSFVVMAAIAGLAVSEESPQFAFERDCFRALCSQQHVDSLVGHLSQVVQRVSRQHDPGESVLPIIYGLGTLPTIARDAQIQRFVSGLKPTPHWHPEIAAILLSWGMSYGDYELERFVNEWRGDLQRVLDEPRGNLVPWRRRLGHQYVEYARHVLSSHRGLASVRNARTPSELVRYFAVAD